MRPSSLSHPAVGLLAVLALTLVSPVLFDVVAPLLGR
jgi:hypothetical protein